MFYMALTALNKDTHERWEEYDSAAKHICVAKIYKFIKITPPEQLNNVKWTIMKQNTDCKETYSKDYNFKRR